MEISMQVLVGIHELISDDGQSKDVIIKLEHGFLVTFYKKIKFMNLEISSWRSNWQSGYIVDVGYKVVLHGKAVKVRQDSAAMDHVRGWRASKRLGAEGPKAMVKSELRLSAMNRARPCEPMDYPHHSFNGTRRWCWYVTTSAIDKKS